MDIEQLEIMLKENAPLILAILCGVAIMGMAVAMQENAKLREEMLQRTGKAWIDGALAPKLYFDSNNVNGDKPCNCHEGKVIDNGDSLTSAGSTDESGTTESIGGIGSD